MNVLIVGLIVKVVWIRAKHQNVISNSNKRNGWGQEKSATSFCFGCDNLELSRVPSTDFSSSLSFFRSGRSSDYFSVFWLLWWSSSHFINCFVCVCFSYFVGAFFLVSFCFRYICLEFLFHAHSINYQFISTILNVCNGFRLDLTNFYVW